MKKVVSVFFLIVFYIAAAAQSDPKADLNALIAVIVRVDAEHPDSVEYYAQKALPLAISLNDLASETKIQSYRAGRIFLNGYFDSAVSINLQMIRKADKHPPYIELAALYYELSGIYGRSNYNEICGKYIRKGLAIAQSLKNTELTADGYNRLGIYYERAAKLDSALYYYEQALVINDREGFLLGKSYSLENIAGIYSQKKESKKALTFFRQALTYKIQIGNKTGLAISYMNLAEVFDSLKQYDSSIFYTLKTQEVANEIHYKDIVRFSYQFLAGLYQKRGDYKTALIFQQRFAAINDSMYNETKSKQLGELNTKYETEKKEQQIASLHQQTLIQSLQIKQRNIFLVTGAGLFIVAIVLAYMAHNRRKLQEQAELQMAINKQQEITAREVIHAEERERRRIAADLHDGVGQLLSVALMNLNGLFKKEKLSPESEKLAGHTLSLVTESYDELRQISHQMIPNTLLKAGLASAVKDMIMRIDQSKLAISLETSGLNERIDEEIETVLYRVIQESVNNVIKHAAATKLNIQLTRDEEGVAITIEDNGKGFDMKQKDKGIGLKNMLSRVQFHKGTIDIDSLPGKGTLVAVFIPL